MALNRLFGLGRKDLIGVDVGSSAVKMVVLENKDGKRTVSAAAMSPIEAAPDDPLTQRANTTRAIEACLSCMNVKTRTAVCSVSGPEVVVRDFKFPPLPAEEVEAAVMLEARQVCPFNADNSAVDYRVFNSDEKQTAGVLVAATDETVGDKVNMAKSVSLNCVLMDVDGLALLNCYKQTEPSDDTPATAILNIGASCTTLAVASVNDMPFIRDISTGANEILDKMLDFVELTPEELLSHLAKPNEAPFDVASVLEQASRKLIGDIVKTLRYYSASQDAQSIKRILACGGFVLVPGFVEILNKSLPAEVSSWSPLEEMQVSGDEMTRATILNNGPAMAVAAGLAMRSI